MQSHRWARLNAYAVPLFVASLVAVVLAGSGLAAVVLLDRGDDGGGTETGACVVGTWELTTYTEQKAGLGNGRMVAGTPVFTFAPDGGGTADYGTATTVEVKAAGFAVDAQVAGRITYRYRISGQTFEFVQQDSSAELSSDIDILGLGGTFTLPTGPLAYTCDEDAMSLSGPETTFAYQRVLS